LHPILLSETLLGTITLPAVVRTEAGNNPEQSPGLGESEGTGPATGFDLRPLPPWGDGTPRGNPPSALVAILLTLLNQLPPEDRAGLAAVLQAGTPAHPKREVGGTAT
jgi:hypothetical protein